MSGVEWSEVWRWIPGEGLREAVGEGFRVRAEECNRFGEVVGMENSAEFSFGGCRWQGLKRTKQLLIIWVSLRLVIDCDAADFRLCDYDYV